MEAGKPSRTAHLSAFMRARHQTAPGPRMLTDPLAVRIAIASDEEHAAASAALESIDWPLAEVVIGRQRFTEDAIAERAAAGLRQVVFLGAGLDTFGYRNPHRDVRVFEVDHPDTQAWKRKRLADAGIVVPGTVTFVQVDFESQSLPAELAAAGFRSDLPAYFVWLGVIYYLTLESAVATIELVADHGADVELAFDYTEPAAADLSAHRRELYDAFKKNFDALGDPYRTEPTPAQIAQILADAGLDRIEDLTLPELAGRYGVEVDMTNAPVEPRFVRATRSGDWQ